MHAKAMSPCRSNFFPARNEKMNRRLWCTIGQLELLNPKFFSVTYGALGSERTKSLEIVENIHAESSVPVAAHITCKGATREEVDEVVHRLWEHGVRHVLPLRGDVTADEEDADGVSRIGRVYRRHQAGG